MNANSVTVDIVSDVVCPWCIIGYQRLMQAADMFGDKISLNVHWHPFELNPDMPEGGENLRAHLAAKYGTTPQDSVKARARLTELGESLGFTFDYFDEMRMYNTFKAHQLIHLARQSGMETAMKLRLFAAFFSERKAVDDPDVLVAEAQAVGIDKSAAHSALEQQTFANQVREEQRQWMSKGIYAVPAFIFNGSRSVSGAQPAEVFAQVLQQASLDSL